MNFRLLLTWSFILFLGYNSFTQNLIPNHSFEDINRCLRLGELCSPEGWRNEFGGKTKMVDSNLYTKPVSGEKLSYIEVWNIHRDIGSREFLQVPLICPLKKNAQYQISFHIKPRYIAVKQLGVCFRQHSRCNIAYRFGPEVDSRNVIAWDPQVVFKDSTGLFLKDAEITGSNMGWRKLTTTYKATGMEKYLFIGSFQQEQEMELIRLHKGEKQNKSIIYIDEVSVQPLISEVLEDCCYEANRQSIYANDLRHACPEEEFDYHTCDTSRSGKIEAGIPFTMDNLNFKINKAVILPEAYPDLDSLAHYLKQHQEYHLKIHGHTDSIGSKEYNLRLSQARADSVKSYLTEKGIAPRRISAKGFGYSRPAATNETAKGRRKNRRVEFYIE